MGVSCFARFKGGFEAPTMQGGPERLEELLEPPATWLAGELTTVGLSCSEPRWCDFEYEIPCSVGERQYRVSLSFDYEHWEWFEVSYQPTIGFLARLLGRSEEAEMTELSSALDAALRQRESVTDLRWYGRPLGDAENDYARHPVGLPS